MKLLAALICLSTSAAWLSWILVVHTVSPHEGGTALLIFYATLGASLLGSFTLAGVLLRTFFQSSVILSRRIHTSLRQAVLLTGIVLLALFLLSVDLFFWWAAVSIVILAACIEGAIGMAKR